MKSETTLIDPADDRPDTRTVSGYAVVMTEPEALIIRRFPIGLPVEAAIRDNSDTVYGTVVGHRLCPECSVYVIVDYGGRSPHPFDHRLLRPIHGDERLHIPGRPSWIVRLLTSLWNALT